MPAVPRASTRPVAMSRIQPCGVTCSSASARATEGCEVGFVSCAYTFRRIRASGFRRPAGMPAVRATAASACPSQSATAGAPDRSWPSARALIVPQAECPRSPGRSNSGNAPSVCDCWTAPTALLHREGAYRSTAARAFTELARNLVRDRGCTPPP